MNIENMEVQVLSCILGDTEYVIVDNGEFGIKPDSTGSDLGYVIYAKFRSTYDKAWVDVTVQHCHADEEMNWIETPRLSGKEEYRLAVKMSAARRERERKREREHTLGIVYDPPVLQKYA